MAVYRTLGATPITYRKMVTMIRLITGYLNEFIQIFDKADGLFDVLRFLALVVSTICILSFRKFKIIARRTCLHRLIGFNKNSGDAEIIISIKDSARESYGLRSSARMPMFKGLSGNPVLSDRQVRRTQTELSTAGRVPCKRERVRGYRHQCRGIRR